MYGIDGAYLAAKYLLEDPKRLDEDGECIADVIVEKLVEVVQGVRTLLG